MMLRFINMCESHFSLLANVSILQEQRPSVIDYEWFSGIHLIRFILQ